MPDQKIADTTKRPAQADAPATTKPAPAPGFVVGKNGTITATVGGS